MTEIEEPIDPARHEPGRAAVWLVSTWCVLTATAEVTLFGSVFGAHVRAWQDRGEGYAIASAIGGFWLLCLIRQWLMRYYPPAARGPRNSGLVAQFVLIAGTTAAGWPQSGAWDGVLILILTFPAIGMWQHLILAHRLHPSELLQVGLALEAKRRNQRSAQEERSMRVRQAQLSAAMSSLGLTAPVRRTAESAPAYEWDVPKGKHEPMVYFLANGDRVKIGTTTELRRRIRTLALRPEHVALLLDGGGEREKTLHGRFASLRDGNTEWFKNTGELADYIAKANKIAEADQEI